MADEILYDGWLKLSRRKFRDRNYEILQDHDAVAAIITTARHDILLVKQFRPALMRETLEIPAGTRDDDSKSDLDCLLGELQEEACLDVHPDQARLAVVYKPNVGFSDSLMKIYHILWSEDRRRSWPVTGDDVYEAVWLSFEELERRVLSGEILDVKTVVAYWYLKAGRAEGACAAP